MARETGLLIEVQLGRKINEWIEIFDMYLNIKFNFLAAFGTRL